MITVEEIKGTANGGLFSLKGKSSDQKPTETYLGMAIENGSSFFEMDTQSIKFYDADTNAWI